MGKTLRKKTELQTKNQTLAIEPMHSSKFASFAIESISDGAFLIAKDARLVYVNPAACKQLGYTREELLSMRVMDFNPYLTQEIWDAVWGVTVRDKIQTIEVEHLTKDGRLIPFEVLANYIEINGEQYSCSFTRDITERKKTEAVLQQSEEKFRSLAEQSPNMIFINCRGRVVYANQKCEETMGYTKDEFYSKSFDFRSLIAPEYLDLVQSAFQKHMQGEEVPSYEYAVLTKDGKRLAVIITTKLIDFENDKAILGIITDITERKKFEEAMKHSKTELSRRIKELEDFYNMAVGRELRMKQLKEENEKLRKELEQYKNP